LNTYTAPNDPDWTPANNFEKLRDIAKLFRCIFQMDGPMQPSSILKAVTCVLFAAVVYFVTTPSTTSAQEYENSLASKLDQTSSNPLAGLLKKPAFLEGLKLPKFDLKKPNIELPKLSSLLPQPDSDQQSLLGKIKTKTDAFFAKAFAFEKLIPGPDSNSDGENEWESVRKSMERILTDRGEENPIRSATAPGTLLQR